MTTYHFYSPKGGQGCTTTAAAFAVLLGRGSRVAIIDTLGDMPAVLGPPQPGHDNRMVPVNDRIDLWVEPPTFDELDGYEHAVFDAGPPPVVQDGHNIMVVRPCYLALRRAVAMQDAVTPDQVILITEPGRALSSRDVERALGVSVTVVEFDPSVARAVDAGLLAARLPRTLAHTLSPLEV